MSGMVYLVVGEGWRWRFGCWSKAGFLSELKRHFSKGTVFRLKSDQPNRWKVVWRTWNQNCQDYLNRKYGDQLAEVANKEWSK